MFRVLLTGRFTGRPMFDQLLTGRGMLASGEALISLFFDSAHQLELRSQAAVPLANELRTFCVISLVCSGVLKLVIVVYLLGTKGFRNL